MAIEVRVSRGYAWRMIILAVVCLVFGVWGVYDYAIAIPRDQALVHRLELLQISKDALETPQPYGKLTPEAKKAYTEVTAELNSIFQDQLDESRGDTLITEPADFEEVVERFGEDLQAGENMQWVALLATIGHGLVAERQLPLTEREYPTAHAAFKQAQQAIEQLGTVSAPGEYDRLTQWAFMLCLPSVPYFLWMYFAAKRRVYRLDDEGTLSTPDGTWRQDEISDIDMGRWMAKSIAWIVPRQGPRVKLDDYKFRNLHLIVGAIAARMHPDDWDSEAKPVKAAAAEAATE